MINNIPNSIHPTLTPSIIYKGTKIDLNFQKFVPLVSYAALHYAKRVDNKYQSPTYDEILSSNMTGLDPLMVIILINTLSSNPVQVSSNFKTITISFPPT